MSEEKKIEGKSYSFKAETKQLLNILIHSIYKTRETFMRELISNASDALNRVRYEMLVDRNVLDAEAELGIRIRCDEEARTLIIEDSGIGMTQDELIKNLGTIAQSGAAAFLEATEEDTENIVDVIGQFGVGFYSVFMVADSVTVVSRSAKPRSRAAYWTATGEDDFIVGKAEKGERGTRIEIKLKEDAEEFSKEYRIKEIIKKHSDYIGFPIYVGDDETQVNAQTPIWRTPKKEVDDEKHEEFYRQLTLEFEKPLLKMHMVTDAPIQLYSVLYVPASAERGMLASRKEDGLKLYSKNILIDEYAKELLPEYLRFMQGVVDTEDLPLNVSRETVQATGMIPRLNKILTKYILRELERLAKKDKEAYETFWRQFGVFLKQGVAAIQFENEPLYPLLRFNTSLHPDSLSSLEEVGERLGDDAKEIHYILGEDKGAVLNSPHLEIFEDQGIEVLLLSEPIDAFMIMGLQQYKDYQLVNVTQAEIEREAKDEKEEDAETQAKANEAAAILIERFKDQLGEKVSDVRKTDKLSRSVARLIDPEDALNPEMQRVYKYLDKEFDAPQKILELNTDHPILTSLSEQADEVLSAMIIEQIYESALLVEGLHPDPSSMAQRIQSLMERALGG